MNSFDTISQEDLCSILRVSNPTTLKSTNNFPKPFFDKRKLIYKKQDVANYFNINNINEPFINIKEASEYLNIVTSRLLSLVKNNEVPSYRLKSMKGSGYLFRKSELDLLTKNHLKGDINFVNYFHGTKIMKDLFHTYVENNFKEDATIREYDVFMLHFFDGISLEKIAQEQDISIIRIRQIFQKTVRRISYRVRDSSKSTVLKLEKQICYKDLKINYLIKLLNKNNIPIGSTDDIDHDIEEIKKIANIYVSFLKEPINIYSDISVRALNILQSGDIRNMYDLIVFCNSYSNNFLTWRGCGKKASTELNDYISIQEDKLTSMTGINTKEFIKNKESNSRYSLIFNEIKAELLII